MVRRRFHHFYKSNTAGPVPDFGALGDKAMNNSIQLGARLLTLVGGLWTATAIFPQTVLAQQVDTVATTDVEILARGPLHEAFAEPVVFDPTAGLVVPKRPPQDIEELPTEQKPEGENVAWIPGYWGWDDDRDDFIWISGFWRVMPPGRQWVPGYWNETTGGYQFVSGFWASNEVTEVQYLPAPPATLEVGPSIPAPSSDYVWNPGIWNWYQTRYVWQPGYWMQPYPNWMWTPASYSWTPRGYVFVNGYWDYTLAQRGLLYAPVYFRSGYYGRYGYNYRPNYLVDIGLLATQLFVRPNYHHYCFGDYYAANYSQIGIMPWFAFHSSGRYGYDPIWVHHRHQHGHAWDEQIQREYAIRRDNRDARPPRTVEISTTSRGVVNDKIAVKPFDQVASKLAADLPLERVDPERRKDFSKWAKQTRDFARERGSSERTAAQPGRENTATGKTRDQVVTAKLALPKSPFVNPGNPEDSAAKSDADRKVDTRDERAKSKTANDKPINTRPEKDKDTTPPPAPDAKKSDDKKADTKKTDVPKSDVPKSEVPKADDKKSDAKKSDDKKSDTKSGQDRTPGTRGKRGRDNVPPPVPRAPTDTPKSDTKATPGDQGEGAKKATPKIDPGTPTDKGNRPRVTPPDAPKSNVPKAETPKSNPPKSEVPKAEAPKAPKKEAPKSNPPKVETPKAETPKSETPKGETPKKPETPKSDKKEKPGKQKEEPKDNAPRETRIPETRGEPRLPTASSSVPKADATTSSGNRRPEGQGIFPRVDTRVSADNNVTPRVATPSPTSPAVTPTAPKKETPATTPRTETSRGNSSASSNRSERAPATSPAVAPSTPRVSAGNAGSRSVPAASSGRSSSGRSTEARGTSNNRDKKKNKP